MVLVWELFLLLPTCMICHKYQLCSWYFNYGVAVVIFVFFKFFPSKLTLSPHFCTSCLSSLCIYKCSSPYVTACNNVTHVNLFHFICILELIKCLVFFFQHSFSFCKSWPRLSRVILQMYGGRSPAHMPQA